jgi:hypothetical protein
MPRNRHRKKPANIVLPPAPQPGEKLALQPSPVAQKVVLRIMNGGAHYLMDNLERVMIDSTRLAEEPEFVDLSFDADKADKATDRWVNKYKTRLVEAEKKSPDEFQQVYDVVRIKIIDELITPMFRKEVEQRLDRLQDRLSTTSDANKLEIVIMLKPILGMKQTPWGLCGLIIAIYNRAMKPAIKAREDEIKVFDAVHETFEEEGEEKVDFRSLLRSPNKLEQIGQKLFGKNPEMRERLENQALDMTRQFEKEMWEGKIPLDLFTMEELFLPFHRLEEEYGQPLTELELTDEQRTHNSAVIMQTIRDIMTPERMQQMRKDIDVTRKTWERDHQKWALLLEYEEGWIQGDVYEANPFILSAFFGQLVRAGKDQKR